MTHIYLLKRITWDINCMKESNMFMWCKHANQSALLIEVEGCFQLTWPGWQQLWTSCCQTVMLAGRSPSVVYRPERTEIQ